MIYEKVLKRILEEFEKGKTPLNIKGGRGYGYGSIYSQSTPPIYGESEAKRKARKDKEKKHKRRNKLNKKQNKKQVDISKKFIEEKEITINELKDLIRSILYEK